MSLFTKVNRFLSILWLSLYIYTINNSYSRIQFSFVKFFLFENFNKLKTILQFKDNINQILTQQIIYISSYISSIEKQN